MKKNVSVWWDSIAKRHNDHEQWWWVARLQKYFKAQGLPIKVHNFGVSGNTTLDVLQRFEEESSMHNQDVVIFAIGINDSIYLDTHKHQVSFKEFHQNIGKLCSMAKKLTSKVVFLWLTRVDESKTTPIPWATNKSYYMKYVSQYDAELQQICLTHDVPFIRLIDVLSLDELDDGLHPNAKWHEKIYIKIRDFLLSNKLV